MPDSPPSCHLKSLSPFIEQQKGKHRLTPLGKDAYNLLLRTGTYNKMARFQKNIYEAIVGNIILWVTAIALVAYLKVDTILIILLSILAGVALTIIYQLFGE